MIASYGKEYAKTGQLDPKFHAYLIRAQARRNLGDYAVEVSIPRSQVENSVKQGREFLQAAKTFLSI